MHWWPGEGTAQDRTGNAHGTLFNGVTFSDGVVGQAFYFDGTDDAFESAPTASMKSLPLTLEAWVKPALRTDMPRHTSNGKPFFPTNVISNDLPGYAGHGFGLNVMPGGGNLVIEAHAESTFRSIAGVVVEAEQWYHIAVAYSSGSYLVYVNGVLVDEYHFAQMAIEGISLVQIGKHNDDDGFYGTERFFKGVVDEVAIYQRALSAQEIARIFAAGSAGKCHTASS